MDRIKHSGGFPAEAIIACLRIADWEFSDLDYIACSYSRPAIQSSLARYCIHLNCQGGDRVETEPERFMATALTNAFGYPFDSSTIQFVKHHIAHAASAFWPSGYPSALVATVDGAGEDESGSLCIGGPKGLTIFRRFTRDESLGLFYLRAINLIGFRLFEEYKVMGLAPYGDAAALNEGLRRCYELLPDGGYRLRPEHLADVMPGRAARHRSEPLLREHKDFAAALQEHVELILLHVMRHACRVTGLDSLCLAGGVAHNCSLNGKLAASDLFKQIYVQPAAHDAGLALGAALSVFADVTSRAPPAIPHVFLGAHIGATETLHRELRIWKDFIDFDESRHIESDVARRIAAGDVVAWVQGRAEFGPRALGNRSILADPRSSEMRDVINLMVKKRESFRPFAPAVIAECAHEYFEIPNCVVPSFMTFVVPVRRDKRSELGAVCHVDGTARVQTVDHQHNPRFWSLIDAFRRLTGVPVLLNTSLNNNVEPMVDSVQDALVTFITTDINLLVIGDFVIKRKPVSLLGYAKLRPLLPAYVLLETDIHRRRDGTTSRSNNIRRCHSAAGSVCLPTPISKRCYHLLEAASGSESIAELIGSSPSDTLIEELLSLWRLRLINLNP
jgi:carbamoyltransferase